MMDVDLQELLTKYIGYVEKRTGNPIIPSDDAEFTEAELAAFDQAAAQVVEQYAKP